MGVLLCPNVLGRIKPDLHEAWFTTLREAYARQAVFQRRAQVEMLAELMQSTQLAEQAETIERMQDTGVSEEAIEEKMQENADALAEQLAGPDAINVDLQDVDPALYAEGLAIDRLVEAAHRQAGRRMALLIAIAILMVLEAALGDMRPRTVRYLSVARYAMMAGWIALLIAQPALLRELPGVFALVLVVASLAAAFVPMVSSTKQQAQA